MAPHEVKHSFYKRESPESGTMKKPSTRGNKGQRVPGVPEMRNKAKKKPASKVMKGQTVPGVPEMRKKSKKKPASTGGLVMKRKPEKKPEIEVMLNDRYKLRSEEAFDDDVPDEDLASSLFTQCQECGERWFFAPPWMVVIHKCGRCKRSPAPPAYRPRGLQSSWRNVTCAQL